MSGLPPRRHGNEPRHRVADDAEVVEVVMEPDHEQPLINSSHAPRADEVHEAHDVEEVSLAQLVQDVEEARREVEHLWFLLLRAVWHAVVERRAATAQHERGFPRRSTPQSSLPLTVDQRRSQLRAIPPKSRRLGLTSGLADLSTHSHAMDASVNNRSGHKPPFLPPARYPVTPALNDDELQRIHHHLYRAVSAAMENGGLASSASTSVLPGGSSHHLHDRSTTTTPRTGWRDQGDASHSATSVSTSFRTAALKMTAEALPPSAAKRQSPRRVRSNSGGGATAPVAPREAQRRPSVVSSTSQVPARATAHTHEDGAAYGQPDPSPPLHSVSMIILQVARRRAIATLYLRKLRLDIYTRRLQQAEVDMRFDYYLQRRLLTRWHEAARDKAVRARDIVRVCIAVWQEAVRESQCTRALVHSFAQGIRTRAALYAVLCARRTRRYWQRWKDAFTYQRVERSLAATASAFQQAHRRRQSRSLARLNGPASANGAIVVLSGITDRYALGCHFQTWRCRFRQRAVLREADAVYRDSQLRLVVRRLCAVAVTTLQRARANPRQRPALTQRVENRVLAVHVAHSENAEALWAYKETCASRVSQSRLLQRAFARWQSRSDTRAAHRFHARHVRLHALQVWLCAASRRQQAHATLRVVWGRWRSRFVERSAGQEAFRLVHETHVRRSVLTHWQKLTQAKRLREWRLTQSCLRYWWERAALRAAVPVLEHTRRTGLFLQWRHRAAQTRQRRVMLALADTLRETALLLGCVRLWSARCADRRHGLRAAEVFEELRAERCVLRLFSLWKRRTFGSTEPYPA